MVLLERQPQQRLAAEIPAQEQQELARHRTGQVAIAAGQVALAGALLVGPTVAVETAFRSEVQDSLGPVPISLSLRPDSESKLSFLPKDNIYIDKSKFGVGLNVRLDGLPRSNSDESGVLSSVFSANSIQLYSGFIDQPEQAAEGYAKALSDEIKDNLLRNEAIAVGSTLAVAAAGVAVQRRRNKQTRQAAKTQNTHAAPPNELIYSANLGHPNKNNADETSRPKKRKFRQSLAGLLTAAAIIGPAAGAADFVGRSFTEEQAAHHYDLSEFEGLGLENVYTDSRFVEKLAGSIPLYYDKFQERNQAANEQFLAAARQSLAEQIGMLAGPKPGETVIAIASDLHSSKTMQSVLSETIEAYNDKYGKGVIKLLAMAGDQSYGTAAERPLVVSQGELADGQPVAAITGNHGSKVTQEQLKDGGVHLLEGETTELNGLTLLGETDPEITKLFGDTVARNKNSTSHKEVGRKLYGQALKDKPTAVDMHEGYTAGGFIGLKDTTKQKMKAWFEQGSSWLVPEKDNVRDLPTSLLFYGHWHKGNYYRVVKNDNGGHTLVAQLGTVGGAIASPRLDHFSTPLSPPGKEAAFALVFIDTENDSQVSGYQDLRYSTDGTAKFSPRVDIEDIFQKTKGELEANQKEGTQKLEAKAGAGQPTQ